LLSRYDLSDSCGVVHNAVVTGLADSVRRAKFPMAVDTEELTCDLTDGIISIAQASPGSGHDQWLTGVNVQFDLTFSVKAWTEFERYNFAYFVSSQSTMHRITKFALDKPGMYSQYTDHRMIEIMQELVNTYNESEAAANRYKTNCDRLKKDGESFDAYSEEIYKSLIQKMKEDYLRVLYSNPCGFRLTAGITTNYRQLKTMYAQRKHHRLPEWREFCRWIESLPCSELITGGKG